MLWSIVAIVRSGQPTLAQFGEGLRRRDLVDEVQVDVERRRKVGGLRANQVILPHFFKQGFWLTTHAYTSPS